MRNRSGHRRGDRGNRRRHGRRQTTSGRPHRRRRVLRNRDFLRNDRQTHCPMVSASLRVVLQPGERSFGVLRRIERIVAEPQRAFEPVTKTLEPQLLPLVSKLDLVQQRMESVRVLFVGDAAPGHEGYGNERQLRHVTSLVERCRDGRRGRGEHAKLRPEPGRGQFEALERRPHHVLADHQPTLGAENDAIGGHRSVGHSGGVPAGGPQAPARADESAAARMPRFSASSAPPTATRQPSTWTPPPARRPARAA